ncbi:MAG: hypothetical protein SF052_10220 [Bacteroidia bacterium]|nr:hypothetical protein [Bacteroidia bacterium]
MNFKHLLIAVFSVLVFPSLFGQKTTTTTTSSEGLLRGAFPPTTIYNPDPIVSNPKNPVDYVGQMHNSAVEFLGNKAAWKKAPVDTLVSWTDVYVKQMNPRNSYISHYEKNSDFLGGFIASTEEKQTEILNTTVLTRKEAIYLKQLLASLEDPTATDKAAVIGKIKGVEATILADASLTQEQRDGLLAHASVARYSLDFWSTMVSVNSSLMPSGTDMSALKVSQKIAKADVKGGVAGGYQGGIVGGIVGGPGGIIPGILGGIATGAILGSIKAALDN